jgi:hypothetical protein
MSANARRVCFQSAFPLNQFEARTLVPPATLTSSFLAFASFRSRISHGSDLLEGSDSEPNGTGGILGSAAPPAGNYADFSSTDIRVFQY